MKMTSGQGQSLATKLAMLPGFPAIGLLIWIPATPPTIPMMGGKKPPPADYGAGKMHALPPVRQELPDATRAGGINGAVRDA